MEAPECPICLQYYDGASVIPRVLACGHSACEECLPQLPRPFSLPAVIRCPACTQIVHFPDPLGAAALPKNIDLLRISLSLLDDKLNSGEKPSTSRTPPKQQIAGRRRFASPVWTNEIYVAWKGWILPQGFVLIEGGGKQVSVSDPVQGRVVGLDLNLASPLIRRLKLDQEVKLLKIGGFDLSDSSSVLEYSYVAKIMCVLSKMSEMQRRELDSVLMMSLRTQLHICNIYGLWLDDESGFLYLVSERKNVSLLEGDESEILPSITVHEEEEEEDDRVHTSKDDRVSGLSSIYLELCEILLGLHSEGFVCGCLGMSCLRLDEFRRVYIDLLEVIIMGRKLRKCISMVVNSTEKKGEIQPDFLIDLVSKIDVLVSPELLFELLRDEGFPVGTSELKYTPNTSSDVWAFSCLIIRLLAGKLFAKDVCKYLGVLFEMKDEEPGYECKTLLMNWTEREDNVLVASFGAKFMLIKQTLVKCLDFNMQSRPCLTDVWRVLKELTVKSCPEEVGGLRETIDHCFVLGELWSTSDECESELKKDQLEGCSDGAICSSQDSALMLEKDSANSVHWQKVASIDLQQHRDCVTGLTVGGEFLFSCSLDKTINVWSMRDFSHVHTFRGPEHRIMAVTFVNEEQQICISGDIGGGIFIWGGNRPFGQEALKKWYEEKDWRYSGIYALAAPGNGHLYTGGGDRLIKAWSLQDYRLSCTMEGHKSVVSALAVCNSVLYSGSWDGSVRLWNLHDHSALAVLAENVPGAVASIHSLYADKHAIVAAYEDGFVKIWLDDESKKSIQVHAGAVFAVGMEGKLLLTGGWDKTVKIQEIMEDDGEVELRQVGSIACDAVITSLLCVNGELLIGFSSGMIKVYRHDQTD